MDEDDKKLSKPDKPNVATLMENVLQHGNPFNLEQPKGIINIATGVDFLMNCISLGKVATNEF